MSSGATGLYILGNEIFNCTYSGSSSWLGTNAYSGTNGGGVGVLIYSSETNYIVNNTFYNYWKGVCVPDPNNKYIYVYNNIFANRIAEDGWDILDLASETNKHYFDYNLYYPTMRNALHSTIPKTLAQSQVFGFDVNSIQADPEFIDGTNNLGLLLGSPAVDAGSSNAVYELYSALYGISITNDIGGNSRPSLASWDIGANELGDTNAHAPTLTLKISTNMLATNASATITVSSSGGTGSITNLTVYTNGEAFAVWTNGSSWATNISSAGTNDITLTVYCDTSDGTNAWGNTNTIYWRIPPTVTATAPAAGTYIVGSLSFSASVSAGSSSETTNTIFIDGIAVATGTSASYALLPGAHSWYSRVIDGNGFSAYSATNALTIQSSGTPPVRRKWRGL